MKAGEEQKKQLAEALVRHKQLKLQNSQLFQKYLEIKEELREHELVVEQIKNIPKERRAWQMIGGVLIEKSVGQVQPDLQGMIQAFQAAANKLDQQLDKNKEEMNAIESKYAEVLKPSSQEEESQKQSAKKASGGVLV